jgi:aspartate aminotransferase-like enzyme
VEPTALAEALGANPDVQGVFVQASESSTGAAHDVRAMGEMVIRTPALFIVDAITGIGSMPLDIDAWGLDIVIGGSQKAFMLPPGLALLTISPKAWERMESARLPRYYFDLRREKNSAAKGESSWTPAISLVVGLAEVLKYVKTLGMDKLIDNAQQLASATRAACGALGLELFARANPSGAVTAVKAPPGLSSSVIVKEFQEKFGSIIADGQGEMAGRIFRIAHLGYYDIADLFALLAELELILIAHDVPVRLGSGVAALQEYYANQPASRKHPVPV